MSEKFNRRNAENPIAIMITSFRQVFLFGLLIPMLAFRAHGQEPARKSPARPTEELQVLVDRAVGKTLENFAAKKLGSNQLAVTLIDLRDPQHPVQAAFRGQEPIYPASVVKLFYLVAAHRAMEDGKLQDTEELRRGMRDMIVDSYNEATSYIVDAITGTTSGPEMSPTEIKAWHDQRNAVNRYFTSLGYTNINVNKKPWGEGPYGRETQAIKLFKPTRNQLTTDATARLLAEIATGKAVSADRCQQMLKLLAREFNQPGDKNDQAHAFTGQALPAGAKLWSKAGWTSQTRHDAAYVELPGGAKFVLVTFTVDHAGDREIIPSVAKLVIEGLGSE
jgi:beta-lactamase class A